jgi:hypothetical protein
MFEKSCKELMVAIALAVGYYSGWNGSTDHYYDYDYVTEYKIHNPVRRMT